MGSYCSSCGTQNDDDARFCRDCGKAMSGSTLGASRYRPVSPGRTVDGMIPIANKETIKYLAAVCPVCSCSCQLMELEGSR